LPVEKSFQIPFDGDTANATIGSGESASLGVNIKAESQKGFVHGLVCAIAVNGTEFDESKTDFTSDVLTITKLDTVPDVFAPSYTAEKLTAFTVSPVVGSTLRTATIDLQAETGVNPSDSGDPTIKCRPMDYYIDSDNGNAFAGPAVEDEDNSATFAMDKTTTISLS